MEKQLVTKIKKPIKRVLLLSFNRLKAYSESKIYTYLNISNKKKKKIDKDNLLKIFFDEKSEFSYNININVTSSVENSKKTFEVEKKKLRALENDNIFGDKFESNRNVHLEIDNYYAFLQKEEKKSEDSISINNVSNNYIFGNEKKFSGSKFSISISKEENDSLDNMVIKKKSKFKIKKKKILEEKRKRKDTFERGVKKVLNNDAIKKTLSLKFKADDPEIIFKEKPKKIKVNKKSNVKKTLSLNFKEDPEEIFDKSSKEIKEKEKIRKKEDNFVIGKSNFGNVQISDYSHMNSGSQSESDDINFFKKIPSRRNKKHKIEGKEDVLNIDNQNEIIKKKVRFFDVEKNKKKKIFGSFTCASFSNLNDFHLKNTKFKKMIDNINKMLLFNVFYRLKKKKNKTILLANQKKFFIKQPKNKKNLKKLGIKLYKKKSKKSQKKNFMI